MFHVFACAVTCVRVRETAPVRGPSRAWRAAARASHPSRSALALAPRRTARCRVRSRRCCAPRSRDETCTGYGCPTYGVTAPYETQYALHSGSTQWSTRTHVRVPTTVPVERRRRAVHCRMRPDPRGESTNHESGGDPDRSHRPIRTRLSSAAQRGSTTPARAPPGHESMQARRGGGSRSAAPCTR